MTLRRKTELKRTGRLRPVSRKRRRERVAQWKVRTAVFQRDGGCILSPYGGAWGHMNRDGQHWGPCFGDPLTFHHLRKASQGGEYTEKNGVTLCAGHNDLIEDYPVAGRDIGLVR